MNTIKLGKLEGEKHRRVSRESLKVSDWMREIKGNKESFDRLVGRSGPRGQHIAIACYLILMSLKKKMRKFSLFKIFGFISYLVGLRR